MEPVKCFSSHAMTYLLQWRNPLHKQNFSSHFHNALALLEKANTYNNLLSNCILSYFSVSNYNSYKNSLYKKKILIKLGVSFLIVINLVECIVYPILLIPHICIYPLSDKPFRFVSKLYESSRFTLLWQISYLFHKDSRYYTFTNEQWSRNNYKQGIYLRREDRSCLNADVNLARSILQTFASAIQESLHNSHRMKAIYHRKVNRRRVVR